MSDEALSTQSRRPPFRLSWRVFAIYAAISLATTAAIMVGIYGPGVLHGVGGRVVASPWRPHLPRLDLLAHAPLAIQVHVATVVSALGVGLVLMSGVKGSRLHRTLGWGFVTFMAVTAIASLFIHEVNRHGFSLLHLFTGWTLIALPVGMAAARRHKVHLHARMMTGLFTGGLIVAGVIAFLPGRLMWRVFFG